MWHVSSISPFFLRGLTYHTGNRSLSEREHGRCLLRHQARAVLDREGPVDRRHARSLAERFPPLESGAPKSAAARRRRRALALSKSSAGMQCRTVPTASTPSFPPDLSRSHVAPRPAGGHEGALVDYLTTAPYLDFDIIGRHEGALVDYLTTAQYLDFDIIGRHEGALVDYPTRIPRSCPSPPHTYTSLPLPSPSPIHPRSTLPPRRCAYTAACLTSLPLPSPSPIHPRSTLPPRRCAYTAACYSA